MQTLSPKKSLHISPLTLASKFNSSPDALLTTSIPSAEDLKISQEQKNSLLSHLMEWTSILDQQSNSSRWSQETEPIVQIGIDNQKQHLLLLSDRIAHATYKTAIIHALQETSEALGKESALVRYYISSIGGVSTDFGAHDVITTELRYYILKDIVNLCGGTYLLPPQQDAYFCKPESQSSSGMEKPSEDTSSSIQLSAA